MRKHPKAKVGASVVMVEMLVIVVPAMLEVQMFLLVLELCPLRRRCILFLWLGEALRRAPQFFMLPTFISICTAISPPQPKARCH